MELTINEALERKWKPVLEHPELAEIADPYRKAVTTILLENQQQALREDTASNFAGSMPDSGGVAKWDPILISLVRRSMPNLIAYDVCGVQPMSGPTGLIFALRSRYNTQNGAEALFQEADSRFSGNAETAPLVVRLMQVALIQFKLIRSLLALQVLLHQDLVLVQLIRSLELLCQPHQVKVWVIQTVHKVLVVSLLKWHSLSKNKPSLHKLVH